MFICKNCVIWSDIRFQYHCLPNCNMLGSMGKLVVKVGCYCSSQGVRGAVAIA